MNAYLLLPQKNVQINDIPPRLMWNIDADNWTAPTSGYCGETSILSAGLLYGQYVPMYLIREVLIDYFIGLMNDPSAPVTAEKMWNNYTNVDWNAVGSPGGDYTKSKSTKSLQEWFKDHGQFYSQVLPQIGDNSGDATSGFPPVNAVLQTLHLDYEHYQVTSQDTKNGFIPWLKQHVVNGHPVTIGLQDFLPGSNDNDFDHIVTVIGWGSNQPLTETQYFGDDEIVFSDHGLVVGGIQPHGGSIPYYFKYTMEIPTKMPDTGGWLPDGGCQDPTNPAWSFIQDLGTKRRLKLVKGVPTPTKNKKAYNCNTYQLAMSPSQKSDGNAGFAIKGLSPVVTTGVQVRIDTDCYYQVPCITQKQATSGIMPKGQMMNHSISVAGLDASLTYNLWLFQAATAAEVSSIPASGFKAYAHSVNVEPIVISGVQTYALAHALSSEIALFVRCELA